MVVIIRNHSSVKYSIRVVLDASSSYNEQCPFILCLQVQLHTLFQQYQDLASSCSEVARERDKHKAEVHLLRDELHR